MTYTRSERLQALATIVSGLVASGKYHNPCDDHLSTYRNGRNQAHPIVIYDAGHLLQNIEEVANSMDRSAQQAPTQ